RGRVGLLPDSRRDGETECRSFTRGGSFEPDAAAVLLDNPLTYRQAHPTPLVLAAAVQALKDGKDLVREPHVDADTVIDHAEDAPPIALVSRYVDTRRRPVPVFERVTDEILK